MAEQTRWLDGRAKIPGVVEKICPKRHIRQNQWRKEWNEMYQSQHCYDFISDYECIFSHPFETSTYFYKLGLRDNLQTAKQQGTQISITNLAHFTIFANEIIESGGFTGGIKKYNEDANGHDVKAKFSWWSPVFGQDDIKLVRDTLGVAIQPFIAACNQYYSEYNEEISVQFHADDSDQDDKEDSDQDMEEGTEQSDKEGSEENDEKYDDDQDDDQDDLSQLQKQFATSKAFIPDTQLYGSAYFRYDINDLCDYYGVHFDSEVQFKILGTFSYKQEVMHAVLVCSQENGDGLFEEYPHVLTPEEDVNNEAVVTRDNNGDWIWKPEATGTEIKRLYDQHISYPMYRRWEHLAFGFHIPDEWRLDPYNDRLMIVPELGDNLQHL